MPLYEYQCNECEHRFEKIQRFSDELVKICPSCGGAVRKLVSSPAIQFKGTGWYITDYARKPGAGQPASEAQKSESKDSKSADSSKTKDSKSTTDSSSSKKPSSSSSD